MYYQPRWGIVIAFFVYLVLAGIWLMETFRQNRKDSGPQGPAVPPTCPTQAL